jgi:hypothetical protein
MIMNKIIIIKKNHYCVKIINIWMINQMMIKFNLKFKKIMVLIYIIKLKIPSVTPNILKVIFIIKR